MPPFQVVAIVAVLAGVPAVIYSARLRVEMIGKLNARNPPERQYDRWGWLIVNKRFNLFTRKYYWYEYWKVFGFDALVVQNMAIAIAMVALGLGAALTLAVTTVRHS